MNSCPCCTAMLLRHVRHNDVYWFCPHCWQEMPNFSPKSSLDDGSVSLLDGHVLDSHRILPLELRRAEVVTV